MDECGADVRYVPLSGCGVVVLLSKPGIDGERKIPGAKIVSWWTRLVTALVEASTSGTHRPQPVHSLLRPVNRLASGTG